MSRQNLVQWGPLFLISGLGLFFELAVIRWLSGEVRLFSYFKNLPLLAAFLGLSIGYAVAGKQRDYWRTFAPLLGLFVVLVFLVGRVASPQALAYPSSGDEHLWYTAPFSYWLALGLFLGMTLIFFLLTMFLFIPLGQATGEEMARHAPVSAYIVNILASLSGVWLFTLLAYWQTSPVIWFGLGLLGIVLYLSIRRVLSRGTLIMFSVISVGLVLMGQGEIWSPYQRLEVSDLYLPRQSNGTLVKVGQTLNVQQVFYQRAINLSDQFLADLHGDIPEMDDMAFSYNLPYRLGPPNARVLIVGAGMGNDVSAALRNSAGHVDAVEIDPIILALGNALHPEHPYADPRVAPFVDDARSFLKSSNGQYDVIAFGLLDSHTLLSGLSSVRLDSFVYTLESFRQVREHLAANGIAVVTFATSAPWIEERLGHMLNEVFGAGQAFVHRGAVGTTFVAGAVPQDKLTALQLAAWQPTSTTDEVPLTTDDWPYLYLRTRQIPDAYWQALLLIGIAGFIFIRRSFPQALRPNWHFWLLGAAFLLIEFKSITELALLFGTTWLVNTLAISGVLLMVLAANLIVLRSKRLNLSLVYGLLFVSLATTFFFPLDRLIDLLPAVRALVSMILLSLPLFFAGLIFAESLRRLGDTAGALAANLGGSVAGGVFEYGSLWWGVKSLYLIAAIIYLGAWFASRSRAKRES